MDIPELVVLEISLALPNERAHCHLMLAPVILTAVPLASLTVTTRVLSSPAVMTKFVIILNPLIRTEVDPTKAT